MVEGYMKLQRYTEVLAGHAHFLVRLEVMLKTYLVISDVELFDHFDGVLAQQNLFKLRGNAFG
jgi:hypothetical protein